MNKRTLRIAGWALGLSLALGGVGVGAAVGASQKAPVEAKATSYTYEKIEDISEVEAGTKVLIVAYYNSATWYYLPSTTTSSAPTATSLTVSADTITGDYDSYMFTLGKSSTNYTFYNGSKYLVNTSANNGVRINSDDTAAWTVTATTNGYKMTNNSRWLGVYNGADWRSYTTSNASNYKDSGEYINFYQKQVVKTISSVDVTTQPTKTTYKVGESLDATGMVVTITYDDTTTSTVTYSVSTASKFTFTGFDSSAAADDQNVTVKYSPDGVAEYTCATKVVVDIINVSANVIVVDVSGLSKNPSEYLAGETLDLTGLSITVGFTDDSEVDYDIASNADFTSKGFSLKLDGVAFDLSTALTTSHSGKSFVVYYGSLHDDSDTVDVTVSPVNTFTQVTDEAKIYPGMKVAIGAAGLGTFATTTLGGKNNNVLTNIAATVSEGVVSSNDVGVFTIGGSVNAWTLSTASGVLGVTAVKELAYGSGTSTWTITIADGVTTMESTNDSLGAMKYNASSPRFTTYASGQTGINLYALAPENDIYGFIQNYMRMGDTNISGKTAADGEWSCTTGYSAVKAAFNALEETDRADFFSVAAYSLAATRLTTWAAANGESFNETTKVLGAYNAKPMAGASNKSNLPLIITIISIGVIASVGLFFVQRKRRSED